MSLTTAYGTFKVNMLLLLSLGMFVAYVSADVAHLTNVEQEAGPPNPYVFSYQAGRAPGHVDRQHTEVSDGSGVVRGAFSYVDPKNQVRTVQYVADKDGFHPHLSHQNEDVEAVKLAKQKHINLYNRIAYEHANAAAHPNAAAADKAAAVASPANYAVLRATEKHLSLYERIAAEHAAIGAQRDAERRALEQQEEQYHGQQQQQQQQQQHGGYQHDSYQIPVAIHYE